MSGSELLGFFNLWALIDIALVALVVYNLLLLIRGTRAVQVLVGLLLVAAVHFGAGQFNLVTLQRLIEATFIVLPFAIVVLFQHEIRRALAQLGRYPLGGLATHQNVVSSFDDVVLVATTLAARAGYTYQSDEEDLGDSPNENDVFRGLATRRVLVVVGYLMMVAAPAGGDRSPRTVARHMLKPSGPPPSSQRSPADNHECPTLGPSTGAEVPFLHRTIV